MQPESSAPNASASQVALTATGAELHSEVKKLVYKIVYFHGDACYMYTDLLTAINGDSFIRQYFGLANRVEVEALTAGFIRIIQSFREIFEYMKTEYIEPFIQMKENGEIVKFIKIQIFKKKLNNLHFENLLEYGEALLLRIENYNFSKLLENFLEFWACAEFYNYQNVPHFPSEFGSYLGHAELARMLEEDRSVTDFMRRL
jgi:hypothetical protein